MTSDEEAHRPFRAIEERRRPLRARTHAITTPGKSRPGSDVQDRVPVRLDRRACQCIGDVLRAATSGDRVRPSAVAAGSRASSRSRKRSIRARSSPARGEGRSCPAQYSRAPAARPRPTGRLRPRAGGTSSSDTIITRRKLPSPWLRVVIPCSSASATCTVRRSRGLIGASVTGRPVCRAFSAARRAICSSDSWRRSAVPLDVERDRARHAPEPCEAMRFNRYSIASRVCPWRPITMPASPPGMRKLHDDVVDVARRRRRPPRRAGGGSPRACPAPLDEAPCRRRRGEGAPASRFPGKPRWSDSAPPPRGDSAPSRARALSCRRIPTARAKRSRGSRRRPSRARCAAARAHDRSLRRSCAPSVSTRSHRALQVISAARSIRYCCAMPSRLLTSQ